MLWAGFGFCLIHSSSKRALGGVDKVDSDNQLVQPPSVLSLYSGVNAFSLVMGDSSFWRIFLPVLHPFPPRLLPGKDEGKDLSAAKNFLIGVKGCCNRKEHLN